MRSLPPLRLRGYGELSAEFTADHSRAVPFSVLTITCENQAKAEIMQAKFVFAKRNHGFGFVIWNRACTTSTTWMRSASTISAGPSLTATVRCWAPSLS